MIDSEFEIFFMCHSRKPLNFSNSAQETDKPKGKYLSTKFFFEIPPPVAQSLECVLAVSGKQI